MWLRRTAETSAAALAPTTQYRYVNSDTGIVRDRLQAVIDNHPDAPGYPVADTLYPFGFGLSY